MRDHELIGYLDSKFNELTKVIDRHHDSLAHRVKRLGVRILATQADLDGALGELETEEGVDNQAILDAFSALEAKVSAGGSAADLQPEVDRVKAVTAGLATFAAGLVPSATPAPEPTPPPASP